MLVAVLQPAGGQNVDPDPEQFFELLADVQQVEQRAGVLEIDEEIDVTANLLTSYGTSWTCEPLGG